MRAAIRCWQRVPPARRCACRSLGFRILLVGCPRLSSQRFLRRNGGHSMLLCFALCSRPATAARPVGQALVGVLRSVAAESPTVVAIDDLQWLDPPSRRAVSFALRRLVDEPVALLATVRMDAHEPAPVDLDQMFPNGRLKRIRVCPLSPGRLSNFCASRSGSTSRVRHLHAACAGRWESLLRARDRASARGCADRGAHDLPLPRSLRDVVHERLARLPVRTRRVLLAAAGLSQPGSVCSDARPHPICAPQWKAGS